MVREAQVVVGAEVDDFRAAADLDRRLLRRADDALGLVQAGCSAGRRFAGRVGEQSLVQGRAPGEGDAGRIIPAGLLAADVMMRTTDGGRTRAGSFHGIPPVRPLPTSTATSDDTPMQSIPDFRRSLELDNADAEYARSLKNDPP